MGGSIRRIFSLGTLQVNYFVGSLGKGPHAGKAGRVPNVPRFLVP
jgi:hypothetical protein